MGLIGRRVDESIGVAGVKYGHSPCQILYKWVELQMQSAQIQTKTKLNAGPWLMQVKTATCAKTDCGLSDNVAIGTRHWSPNPTRQRESSVQFCFSCQEKKKKKEKRQRRENSAPSTCLSCAQTQHQKKESKSNKPAFASIKSF